MPPKVECAVDCPYKTDAEDAVKRVFAILGVNIDEPREVAEFQENLRFAAIMRRAADRGLMVAADRIAVGLGTAVLIGIISVIWHHT